MARCKWVRTSGSARASTEISGSKLRKTKSERCPAGGQPGRGRRSVLGTGPWETMGAEMIRSKYLLVRELDLRSEGLSAKWLNPLWFLGPWKQQAGQPQGWVPHVIPEGPALGSLFHCHRLEILNSFWTRSCTLSFCTEAHTLCSSAWTSVSRSPEAVPGSQCQRQMK
jgi:hypothetical protein